VASLTLSSHPLLAPLSFASSHAQVHLDSDGATDTSGYTPLHYASRNGHASCVDLLIEHQVNLPMISPRSPHSSHVGVTPHFPPTYHLILSSLYIT